MRFLYKLLFGLIIFNAMLILIADFFPASVEEEKATDSDYSEYETIDQGLFQNMWVRALSTGGAVFGLSLIAGVLARQVALFAGIGAFIALFVGLWSGASAIITRITNYPVVDGLMNVITICIGILMVISVIEILTAQRGAD